MPKFIRRSFSFAFRNFFNFPRWMGWRHIKDSFRYFFSLLKGLRFKAPKGSSASDFLTKMMNYGLIPEDLLRLKRRLITATWLYLIAEIVAISYFIFLIRSRYFFPAFLTFFIVALLLLLTASSHYFYIQIREQRLSMSISEWLFHLRNTLRKRSMPKS